MRTCLLSTTVILVPVFFAFYCNAAGQELQVDALTCEFLHNPVAIDATQPRLSWQLHSDARGTMQEAYHILVASTETLLDEGKADLWDTGKKNSDQSILVAYSGKPLVSRQVCFWKVRVWDNHGNESPWSAPARWGMGLLNPGDWEAQWIGLDEELPPNVLKGGNWIWYPEGDPAVAVPPGTRYFRGTFDVADPTALASAVCNVAVDNVADIYVNGEQVRGSSDFHQAVMIDIASLLRSGKNVVAVAATNHHEYDNPAGLIVVVELKTKNGEATTFITDEHWKAAKEKLTNWTHVDFDDASWALARVGGPNGIEPWKEVSVEVARDLPARMLRKEFVTEAPVRRATAHISGLGLFELYINGSKIGDQVLAPAVSEYDKRAYSMSFDVTEAIRAGENAVGVMLGSGRYFAPRSTLHRDFGFPKLLFQLELEREDGRIERVVSDGTWKITTDGPIRMNNEYDGETYDARMELPDWSTPSFDDMSWNVAATVVAPGGAVVAQMTPPIRVMETLKPKAIAQPQPGMYIADMGQNMVGWCRMKVSGSAGAEVRLRFAEVLKDDGTLYLANIRGAKVTDTYILKGGGEEVYEPRFTYHGFRYVEITGFPGEPTLETLVGCVVHDDLAPAGAFACSNPLINRIHENIVWGTRGNYRSMPTDCPQRDERQGWLGDRSEESRGETYLFQVAPLYAKWVQDMDDAQNDEGSVPDVAPSYYPFYNDNVTWPSSFIIIPGALYDQFGDLGPIEKHYPGMQQWIAHMTGYLEDGILPKDNYGDWCVPPEDPKLIHSNDPKRKTAGPVLGTAYFYHDLNLMARYADLLGKTADASAFRALAGELKEAFIAKYFNRETHDIDNGSQTASVLALAFGLLPEGEEDAVFNALTTKIVESTDSHVGTGLIGGQWLMRTLSNGGRTDLAYTMASQTTYPSWGYMIEKGATTIWELWNGDTADPSMNSHNHVMLVGDLVLWIYEYLGGIRPDAPGFKRIALQPAPVHGLEFVNARHDSPFGAIISEWSMKEGRFVWSVTVPPNTTATVHIPTKDRASITESGRRTDGRDDLTPRAGHDGYVVYELGSGAYDFSAAL